MLDASPACGRQAGPARRTVAARMQLRVCLSGKNPLCFHIAVTASLTRWRFAGEAIASNSASRSAQVRLGTSSSFNMFIGRSTASVVRRCSIACIVPSFADGSSWRDFFTGRNRGRSRPGFFPGGELLRLLQDKADRFAAGSDTKLPRRAGAEFVDALGTDARLKGGFLGAELVTADQLEDLSLPLGQLLHGHAGLVLKAERLA